MESLMPKQMTLFVENPLILSLGGQLQQIQVAYQTYGKLNPQRNNAVLLCHALTGDAEPYYADFELKQGKQGWWQQFIGKGRALDPEKYFLICSNVLGGCKGTTGPSSLHPEDQRPYGSRFPQITVRDIVQVQKALLDCLNIPHLHAVVGGSFGGMQATQWAISYPDFVSNVINLCSSLHFSPEAIGFNHVMRQIIVQDPNFNGGDYYHQSPPNKGLATARMLGMLTYRTDKQLAKAFGRAVKQDTALLGDYFQVESYLSYQGQKFLSRFDANSYLQLLRALDLFDPAIGFDNLQQALRQIKARYTLVAVTTDQLFKLNEMQKSRDQLQQAGVELAYYEISSDFGHDAFLVDEERFATKIRFGLGEEV
ncbi:homoserine O-acetyltransferase [Mergibacter septicus]|uniref:Homoserine O-acetyltransferase n=2 Tax=Mergibacter septicus TaxID=221402 RepID=A0A8E3MGA0_9PAST|nr:homoserine O-acetyltransferase [Mergibacter septicus]QDJ12847.1 homoserine O-acetyltransferase [Mergibacter septicus]QDJ14623.1 homoserine O-acetyltransferase [Mergibacter septicus]UTU47944.1 homoserine O-acetyltransferase [Mergibacter septicus]